MSELAILVPTLGRAVALAPLFESIRATTPADAYRVVFVVDHDDTDTHEAIAALPHGAPVDVIAQDGTYPQKVNAGLRGCDEPLLLPAADDVVFHPNWFENALDTFGPGIEVVGTNDLTPVTRHAAHSTMPIVTRGYVEFGAVWGDPGILFHEGYHHGWVETELNELACSRGVWTFCADSIIEHRHHSWGMRELDETDFKGNQAHREEDEALFLERRARWA